MIYHVSTTGCDSAAGSKEAPFRTINRAAAVAAPGDTVQVHAGEYREWVDPKCGGLNDDLRITYEAAPGEHVVIKGSEIISGWEKVEGTVWKKVLPNTMFGDWNPYALKIEGDWIEEPTTYEYIWVTCISMAFPCGKPLPWRIYVKSPERTSLQKTSGNSTQSMYSIPS